VQLVAPINFVFYLTPSSIEVISDEGILRIKSVATAAYSVYSFFPRGVDNIKVTYKYGFSATIPNDLYQAIINLVSVEILRRLANETGGGSLSVQGFSRDYGMFGKYTDYRKSLSNQAIGVLKSYATTVTGA
jgi:hypothetical protein